MRKCMWKTHVLIVSPFQVRFLYPFENGRRVDHFWCKRPITWNLDTKSSKWPRRRFHSVWGADITSGTWMQQMFCSTQFWRTFDSLTLKKKGQQTLPLYFINRFIRKSLKFWNKIISKVSICKSDKKLVITGNQLSFKYFVCSEIVQ